MVDGIGLYFRLIGARIQSQMQYKVSFLIDMVSNLTGSAIDFAGILIIFGHTPALMGWRLAEVAVLYGLVSSAFALAEMIGGGFDYFPLHIREGVFDQVLIRPLDSFFQIMTADFVIKRVGRLSQAVVVLTWAVSAAGLTREAWRVLALIPVVVGGCLFFMGLLIIQATVSFWTVESMEVFNIITYGGTEVLSHPLEIYHHWLQRFFVYILPMAFISYIPAAVLLGRIPVGVPVWMAPASPLAGLGVFCLARRFWRFGVRHYQSTGS